MVRAGHSEKSSKKFSVDFMHKHMSQTSRTIVTD